MKMSISIDQLLMRTVCIFNVILCCSALSQSAIAVETPQCEAIATGKVSYQLGTVIRIKGEVTALAVYTGTTRRLQQGSPIFVGEKVHAAATGEAVIKTDDEGYVAIRPNSEFVTKRFVAQGNKKTDSMVLQLLTGSMRILTGWIGKLNPDANRIITPSATIGVRGTDHEPYVLPADLEGSTKYKAGTYDKVNRGKTTLGEGDQLLEIEAGRVGFARKTHFESKGLMTILMPVLLDKVPDFYIPGQFDAELDKFSMTANEASAIKLEQKLKADATAYDPTEIAKKWLQQFDTAVVNRDAPAILAQFSPDVKVRAIVRDQNGKSTTVEFDREELAQSTIAAAKGLEKYSQRRLTVDAEQASSGSSKGKICDQIVVRSSVIEQGVQSGKSYRLESNEEYLLKFSNGKWLAIKAQTTQR
jgi:hypothetical protein